MSSANVTLINVEKSIASNKPLSLRSVGNLIYGMGSKKQINRPIGELPSSGSSLSKEDRDHLKKTQQGGDHHSKPSHSNYISKNGEENHKDQGNEPKPARRQRRYYIIQLQNSHSTFNYTLIRCLIFLNTDRYCSA